MHDIPRAAASGPARPEAGLSCWIRAGITGSRCTTSVGPSVAGVLASHEPGWGPTDGSVGPPGTLFSTLETPAERVPVIGIGVGPLKDLIRRLGRAAFAPFRRGLGISELESRIDHLMPMEQQLARFDSIDGRMLMIHRDVIAYREGADEARDAMVAAAGQFGAEVARLDETRDVLGREIAHRLMHESLEAGLPAVTQGIADVLNFAESSRGFRAEAGLWLNPPVVVEYGPGSARVAVVNERIVEAPFVMAQVASLPLGSRILDVGADESTVAFSLASLGYDVTALDLNGYPFRHPNLHAVKALLEDFRPDAPFDAVVCLSSIEHFGLGHYGPDSHDSDADVRALERLREMTRPGGRLVLTTPYGRAAINDVERTYDDSGLARLLAAWSDPKITIAVQRDATTWALRDPGEEVPHDALQVALVTAIAGS